MVEECLRNPGTRAICIREVQKDLRDSAKLIIEDKIRKFNLGEVEGFRVKESEIETPGGGVILFKGMNHYTTGRGTSQSIKSLEGFSRAWVAEAQTMSESSLGLLTPTIREEGSEIWFSWNPTRKSDAVDKLFRGKETPSNSLVIEANYRDNPWFPQVLEQERRDCIRIKPDQYPHIWDGEYATVLGGAYYARSLAQAKQEGRIGKVARDPLMQLRAFWDIGGTGDNADACAIWIAQFVGREIRVLDYYEAQGQELSVHLNWMRSNNYESVFCVLPHDGSKHETIVKTTYEGALRAAGFKTKVIPNQGRGAYLKRIEAGRRLFPSIWFNETTTEAGRDALGWYHEKRDEARNVGLGEDHDWSSHGADAFGLMCIDYEEPRKADKPIVYPKQSGIV